MKTVKFAEMPFWMRCASAAIRCLPAARYRLMNWLCRKPHPLFWGKLNDVDGGYRFLCDLRDGIAREVCFTGRYEPQETAIVKTLLRPGDIFFDVGANWGYFTLLAANCVGEHGRVISLEPDPRLFSILRRNVTKNRLGQVTALQIAAADRDLIMTLAGYDEEGGGNFGISRLVTGSSEGKINFEVSARTLDDLFREFGVSRINLLKMDIEGAEQMALIGLEQGINERRVDRLLLELHPIQLAQHGHSVKAIFDRMTAAGYQPWRIDHSPTTTRRSAYARHLSAAALLQPITGPEALDAWPHLLWVAPGLEALR